MKESFTTIKFKEGEFRWNYPKVEIPDVFIPEISDLFIKNIVSVIMRKRSVSLSLKFLIFLTVPRLSFTDFHFCNFGPQRFSFEIDCPGGVFFKTPVTTDCTYFAKSGDIGDGRVTISSDVCDPNASEDVDTTEAKPQHTFGVSKIQEIAFQGDAENPTGGVDPSVPPECVSSCFASWKAAPIALKGDEETDANEEPEYTYPKLDADQEKEQAGLTKQLLLNFVFRNDGGRSDLRVAKLLEASFLVMSSYCGEPYISNKLLARTLDAFFFFAANSNKSVKDVGVREFDQLLDVLSQCRFYDSFDAFEIIGDPCTEVPTILGAIVHNVNGSRKKVLVKPAPNLNQTDPFIEASWQAISFITAQCFRFHKPQFNLHHIYQVAMEALWSEEMLLRWPNPIVINDTSFWNNILGTINFEIELQNINTCAKIAYLMNPYRKRLERPYKKSNKTVEEKQESGGWTGTEEEYWKMYEQKGGFRTAITSMGGECYQSDIAKDEARSVVQEACAAGEAEAEAGAADNGVRR